MSKNKKHRNNNIPNITMGDNQNTQNIDENIEDVLEDDEEEVDEIEEDTVEETDVIEEPKKEVTEETPNVNTDKEPEETTPVVVVPTVNQTQKPTFTSTAAVFYKIGTDFVNGKCINLVIATTDLIKAKAYCDEASDNNRKTYHVFDKEGNAVYTAEYSIPRDNCYRVGTNWKNGECINLRFSGIDRDEACKQADENTRKFGIVHNVYNPRGKIIFTSKTKLTLFAKKKRGMNYVNRNVK